MIARITYGLVLLSAWVLLARPASGQGARPPRPAGAAPATRLPAPRIRLRLGGRVEYADHSGIAGVEVSLLGTKLQKTTDLEGRFALAVSDSVYRRLETSADSLTLRLDYLGLWAQQIRVAGAPLLLPNETVDIGVLATPASTTIYRTSTIRHPGSKASLDVRESEATVPAQGLLLTRPISLDTSNAPVPDVKLSKQLARLPQIPTFPVLPPPPTTPPEELPRFFVDGARRLRDVDERLRRALEPAGYGGHTRYYAYPKGFALVTLTERTDGQAQPLPPDRFNVKEEPQTSWAEWFKIWAKQVPKGYFRVMVFIVTTNDVLTQEDDKPSVATVLGWASHGPGALPVAEAYAIGNQPCTARHHCTVLVYELKKLQKDQPAAPFASGYSSLQHLARSGVRLKP